MKTAKAQSATQNATQDGYQWTPENLSEDVLPWGCGTPDQRARFNAAADARAEASAAYLNANKRSYARLGERVRASVDALLDAAHDIHPALARRVNGQIDRYEEVHRLEPVAPEDPDAAPAFGVPSAAAQADRSRAEAEALREMIRQGRTDFQTRDFIKALDAATARRLSSSPSTHARV